MRFFPFSSPYYIWGEQGNVADVGHRSLGPVCEMSTLGGSGVAEECGHLILGLAQELPAGVLVPPSAHEPSHEAGSLWGLCPPQLSPSKPLSVGRSCTSLSAGCFLLPVCKTDLTIPLNYLSSFHIPPLGWLFVDPTKASHLEPETGSDHRVLLILPSCRCHGDPGPGRARGGPLWPRYHLALFLHPRGQLQPEGPQPHLAADGHQAPGAQLL